MRFLENVLVSFFRLWTRTLRYQFEGLENVKTARKSGGIFLGTWHGKVLVTTPCGCDRGFISVVSPVWEGEIIAKVLTGLGFEIIRGSERTNRIQGFKQAVRALRNGETVSTAMDGPSGPAKIVKPGIITMAALGRSAIIPVTGVAQYTLRLPTWDKHEIPLPFTRIFICFTPPISLPERPTLEEIELTCTEIEKRMDEAEKQLERALH